jgi:endogenous inhibitor of DNA gyrase (YacG/DUF329 family)
VGEDIFRKPDSVWARKGGMMEEKTELKILCPYCGKPYTAEMLHKLWLTEGSYTTDCVASRMDSSIEIICTNCKKLVYKKEISETIDDLPERHWSRDE